MGTFVLYEDYLSLSTRTTSYFYGNYVLRISCRKRINLAILNSSSSWNIWELFESHENSARLLIDTSRTRSKEERILIQG